MKRTLIIIAAILCCIGISAKDQNLTDSYNYQRGVEAVQAKDLDEGIDYLAKELSEHPKNGYAQAWMSSAQMQKGETGNALYAINQAIQNLPKKDAYYRAWSYDMRSRINLELQDTAQALQDVSTAIKLQPKNEDWWEHRGVIYAKQKNWAAAEADYMQYTKLQPGLIRGYLRLGDLYMKQERYQDALDKYTHANRLAQRSYTLSSMAEAEIKLSKWSEASTHIVDALEEETYERTCMDLIETEEPELAELLLTKMRIKQKKNPNASEWLFYMSVVESAQTNWEEAIRLTRRIIKLDGSDFYTYQLARQYQDMGDFDNALRYSEEALAADSADFSNRLLHLRILAQSGRMDEALSELDKLIEDDPETEFLYDRKGSYLFLQKRYDEAIEAYNTLLALDDSYGYEYYMRGRCYDALGKTDKAKKDYQKAEGMIEEPAELAFIKLKLGKTEEAEELILKAVAADSTGNGDCYNIACYYSLKGDKEQALTYLEKTLQKPYTDFRYLLTDPDFEPIYGEEFDALVSRYRSALEERIARFNEDENENSEKEERIVEVPFTASNGVTKVDCTINELPLNFVFDTGASDVTISQVEATFMLKNGYLNKKDISGKQYYQTADGNISVGTTIILQHINFGGLELRDVKASVVASQKAPLLLGQSVLQRLGKIEIDNERKVLKITTKQ